MRVSLPETLCIKKKLTLNHSVVKWDFQPTATNFFDECIQQKVNPWPQHNNYCNKKIGLETFPKVGNRNQDLREKVFF